MFMLVNATAIRRWAGVLFYSLALLLIIVVAPSFASDDPSYECLVGGGPWCEDKGQSKEPAPASPASKGKDQAVTPRVKPRVGFSLTVAEASEIVAALPKGGQFAGIREAIPSIEGLAAGAPKIAMGFKLAEELNQFMELAASVVKRRTLEETDKADPNDVIAMIKHQNKNHEVCCAVAWIPHTRKVTRHWARIALAFSYAKSVVTYSEAVADFAPRRGLGEEDKAPGDDVIALTKAQAKKYKDDFLVPTVGIIQDLSAKWALIAGKIYYGDESEKFAVAAAKWLESNADLETAPKASADDAAILVSHIHKNWEAKTLIPLARWIEGLPGSAPVVALKFNYASVIVEFMEEVADAERQKGRDVQREAIDAAAMAKLIDVQHKNHEQGLALAALPYIGDLKASLPDLLRAFDNPAHAAAFNEAATRFLKRGR